MRGSGGSRSGRLGATVRRACLVAPALTLTGCSAIQRGALRPRGPNAERLADLFSISFWTAVVVAAIVLGLLAYAIFRRRADDDRPRIGDGTRFVAIGGLVLPSVILLALMVLTFGFLAQQPTSGDLEVTVTGHQFWWEIRYPEDDFSTANELHIPVGTEVELTLQTQDVLHSFWVPELAGKADMVPGRTNTLIIEADEPGTYRGQCAEYCGLQHANMAFLVIAHPEDEYRDWVEGQARPAVVQDGRGEEIFERHACAGCHTIRGTSADGDLGPDLTHLASRETLGAATIPNTRGHLGGWVVNSQTIKPGNEMPPITTLDGEELTVLLEYLENLE